MTVPASREALSLAETRKPDVRGSWSLRADIRARAGAVRWRRHGRRVTAELAGRRHRADLRRTTEEGDGAGPQKEGCPLDGRPAVALRSGTRPTRIEKSRPRLHGASWTEKRTRVTLPKCGDLYLRGELTVAGLADIDPFLASEIVRAGIWWRPSRADESYAPWGGTVTMP